MKLKIVAITFLEALLDVGDLCELVEIQHLPWMRMYEFAKYVFSVSGSPRRTKIVGLLFETKWKRPAAQERSVWRNCKNP